MSFPKLMPMMKMLTLPSKFALPVFDGLRGRNPLLLAVLSGVVGSLLIYILLGVFVQSGGPKVLQAIEASLASEKIPFPVDPDEMKIADAPHESVAQDYSAYATPLPPAPVDGVSEQGRFGLLPVIAQNRLSPFDAYKKPFEASRSKPSIALVVADYGMNAALSQEALERFPAMISLMISPYAPMIEEHQKAARAAGHEIWLQIPMETDAFPSFDPGPKGILSTTGLQYNRDNLEWSLSRTTGYAGVAGYTSGAFDSAEAIIRGLFQGLFARGVGYLEMNPKADAFSYKAALAAGIGFEKNMLSSDYRFAAPEKTFEYLKLRAEQKGSAVGVVLLTPALLESIDLLVAKTEREGFQVVPLSAVIDGR